jgi:hypothetical protein
MLPTFTQTSAGQTAGHVGACLCSIFPFRIDVHLDLLLCKEISRLVKPSPASNIIALER